MGWLKEQILERAKQDQAQMEEALRQLNEVVMGPSKSSKYKSVSYEEMDRAIIAICAYYHCTPGEIKKEESFTDIQQWMEERLRPSQMMKRSIRLKGRWDQDGMGALLVKHDENILALLPHWFRGYVWVDPQTNQRRKLTKQMAERIEEEAYCFYPPFPQTALDFKALLQFALAQIQVADVIFAMLTMLGIALLGMFLPYASHLLYDTTLAYQSYPLLIGTLSMLACMRISTFLFQIIQTFFIARMETKANLTLSAAMMMRLLHLPVTFFQSYGAGTLAERMDQMRKLCHQFLFILFTTVVTFLCSLLYLIQITLYAPALLPAASLVLFLQMLLLVVAIWKKRQQVKLQTNAKEAETDIVYGLYSGIQKIKNAGAEQRVFAKWAQIYRDLAKAIYAPSLFLKLYPIITQALTYGGMLWFYQIAWQEAMDPASYLTFQSTYGIIHTALLSLIKTMPIMASAMVLYHQLQPLLQAVPKDMEQKQIIQRLSGTIECNNVSFRYHEQMPYLLNNVSLKIKANQYVAIVGETGCGKSTLMRLLLGFEVPQTGAIYYDGKDMTKVDVSSLRKKIGVVLQDGKLFQGDIYSNITISAPWLTLEDAWEAAELAGIKEDIERMPMKMYTLLSEGSGGISGGQRQRLLIARAIAPKPKILFFDEATSALDNITQKQVSDALDSLKCTRIVIAHRLSTIRHCDRILVLHQGSFIEDGTYEELMRQRGYFYDLVQRQQYQPEHKEQRRDEDGTYATQ